jgi:DNA polymerase-1
VPPDRVAPDGRSVNGLFAVARAIRRVLAWKVPARAVAVVDAGAPDPAWPEPLRAQLHALPELLGALGLHVVVAPREVHAVAAYATRALVEGDDVVIVGVDKRFAQLVRPGVTWYDANKDARYTEDIVQKRFDVPPSQVAEWLALVGDDDQMPGVAGIGAKGATSLLQKYGTVAAALADLDAIGGRAGNALRKAVEIEIPRELERARLDTTEALERDSGALTFAPHDASARNELFQRLGFVELLDAPPHDATSTRPSTPVVVEIADLESRLASLGSERVALAALLDDPAPVRSALVGMGLSARPGEGFYVPRSAAAWARLATWLEDDASPKEGHDLGATVVALRQAGITLRGITFDSACASHLSEPSNWAPHDLGIVAKPVLGRALRDDDAVRGVGRARKSWSALSKERAAEIAVERAEASAAIGRALAPRVDATLLAEYLELTDTLVRMELVGLAVDRDALAAARVAFETIEADLERRIHEIAGHPFNVNSGKQLGDVLFAELKLPVVSHTKTGWSTAQDALERIEHAHPIVPLVLRYRLLRRMRDSWIVALDKLIDDDGRVHSRFHVARSFSGRLVNTNPDLARVPGRTEEMAMIRRAFVAPPGKLLMSVDFSQLGLFVLAHLTRDPALVEPLRAQADLHRLTAAAVLDKPAADLTEAERQLGKVVNFATFAGQGASALALSLGVPAAEAKAYIARFDAHYRAVRAFQDEQERLVREQGHIVTLAGRRWPIGGLESLDSQLRSYAERLSRRATHEGSVSDVSRRALLDADRALRREGLETVPLLQILDEVLFEVPEGELERAAKVCAKAMRDAFKLEVPLRVGVWVGPNWADLAPHSVG